MKKPSTAEMNETLLGNHVNNNDFNEENVK